VDKKALALEASEAIVVEEASFSNAFLVFNALAILGITFVTAI